MASEVSFVGIIELIKGDICKIGVYLKHSVRLNYLTTQLDDNLNGEFGEVREAKKKAGHILKHPHSVIPQLRFFFSQNLHPIKQIVYGLP